MESRELMRVEQLPVIIAQIDVIGKRADELIGQAESLVVTKDSKQTAKKIKAALNKEKDMFDAVRLNIKKEIMKPYNEVEKRFKDEIIQKYERAYQILNDKVLEIDNAEIAEKTQEIKSFLQECLANAGIDFVTYEQTGINVTLSATKKALKKQVTCFVDRIKADLELIDTQAYREEIYVEYIMSLNVSEAIKQVIARHQVMDAEKQKSDAREQAKSNEIENAKKIDYLTTPAIVEDEEKLRFEFYVEDTKEKLKTLIAFLKDGGYTFGDISTD